MNHTSDKHNYLLCNLETQRPVRARTASVVAYFCSFSLSLDKIVRRTTGKQQDRRTKDSCCVAGLLVCVCHYSVSFSWNVSSWLRLVYNGCALLSLDERSKPASIIKDDDPVAMQHVLVEEEARVSSNEDTYSWLFVRVKRLVQTSMQAQEEEARSHFARRTTSPCVISRLLLGQQHHSDDAGATKASASDSHANKTTTCICSFCFVV